MSLVPRLTQLGRPVKNFVFNQGAVVHQHGAAPGAGPAGHYCGFGGKWTSSSSAFHGNARGGTSADSATSGRDDGRPDLGCPPASTPGCGRYAQVGAILSIGFQILRSHHRGWSGEREGRRTLWTSTSQCCPLAAAKSLAGIAYGEDVVGSVALKIFPDEIRARQPWSGNREKELERLSILTHEVEELALKEVEIKPRPHRPVAVILQQEEPKNPQLATSPLLPKEDPSPTSPNQRADEVTVTSAAQDFSSIHEQTLARVEVGLALDMIAKDEARSAFRLLRRASSRGHPEALHNLGVMYLQGLATKRSYAKAFKCFSMASDLGYAPSIFNLALFYRNGLGVVTPDLKKAAELLDEAKRKQHPQDIGASASGGTSRDRNRTPIRSSTVVGDAEAACSDGASVVDADAVYLVGRAHHFGLAGMAVDLELALACYELAAARGHAEALKARDRLRGQLLAPRRKRKTDSPPPAATPTSDCHSDSSASTSGIPQLIIKDEADMSLRASKSEQTVVRLDSIDSGLS